jgi:hypothetical protein
LFEFVLFESRTGAVYGRDEEYGADRVVDDVHRHAAESHP